MRIADMRVHPIAIADPPLRSSYGLHAPYALRTVLELESEDGVTGISEAHGGDASLRAFAEVRPRVLGADAFRLSGLLAPLLDAGSPASSTDRSQTYRLPGENPLDASARVYSAIEIACLDLLGKSLGVPVCDLLGGRVRDEVSFSAYLFYKHAGGGGEGEDAREDEYGEALTPGALVREARQMIATYGFGSVKLKAGVLDPEIDIETLKMLHQALGPGVPLRLDPNCAWSVDTSARVGSELREELAGEGYLEDPTAGLGGLAAVRRRLREAGLPTPLASNVAVTSFADLPEVVRQDAVQIVLCDPHYWGGLRRVQHLGTLCRTFGLGLSMHSNSHLGVSLMAMAHAAAVTPHLTYACDTHYPWQSAEDEVVAGGRIPIVNGAVRIPEGGGLGIALDYDQLARGRERYARCPYRRRDDEEEMRRRVDPRWRRILPRW